MATTLSGSQVTLGDSTTVDSAATTVGATTVRSGETYTGRRGGGVYAFDTNVPGTTDGSVEPSSGQLYFNNATAANVTRIVIHKTSFDGGDLNSFMDIWETLTSASDGFLIIKSNVDDDTSGIVLKMTAQTDHTNHRSITCTFVAGTIPNTDEEVVQVNFVPFGRKGSSPDGPQGDPGNDGANRPASGSECLVYGMQVLLHNNTLINVENLRVGNYISISNQPNVYTRVEAVLINHIREGYYIVNNELMISNDHPVMTNYGKKKVEELNIGDFVGDNEVRSLVYNAGDVKTVSIITSAEDFNVYVNDKIYSVNGKYSTLLKPGEQKDEKLIA